MERGFKTSHFSRFSGGHPAHYWRFRSRPRGRIGNFMDGVRQNCRTPHDSIDSTRNRDKSRHRGLRGEASQS